MRVNKNFKLNEEHWALINNGGVESRYAYSNLLASNGINIYLLSSDKDIMHAKKKELIEGYDISVNTISLEGKKPRIGRRILNKILNSCIQYLVFNRSVKSEERGLQNQLEYEISRFNKHSNIPDPKVISYIQ